MQELVCSKQGVWLAPFRNSGAHPAQPAPAHLGAQQSKSADRQ